MDKHELCACCGTEKRVVVTVGSNHGCADCVCEAGPCLLPRGHAGAHDEDAPWPPVDYHKIRVRIAMDAVFSALASARATGERTDCLRVAADAMRGAWRNLTVPS